MRKRARVRINVENPRKKRQPRARVPAKKESGITSIQPNLGTSLEGMSSNYNKDLKTLVLCIYNINQNGTANTFCEGLNDYFISDKDDHIKIHDMNPEKLSEFFTELSTAKEVKLADLGLRLILLIYNCNQNGASNTAKVGHLE